MKRATSLALMGLASPVSAGGIAFGPAQQVLNSAIGFSSIFRTSVIMLR